MRIARVMLTEISGHYRIKESVTPQDLSIEWQGLFSSRASAIVEIQQVLKVKLPADFLMTPNQWYDIEVPS